MHTTRLSATAWRRPIVVAILLGLVAAACGSGDGDGDEAARGRFIAQEEARTWQTWILESPGEIAVPPPPADGSEEARAEDEELREFAELRTPEVSDTVRKWAGDTEPISTPWMEMNLEFVSARAKDPPLASRGYALMAVAVYDALIATWHWKYEYGREAPDVVEHLSEPSPTPSYPNEHAAIAGAASRVLAYLFPERPALRLDESALQAAESRVFAGAARRSDVEAGLELGRQVAERVIAFAHTDGAEDPCNAAAPGGAPEYYTAPPGRVANPVQPCAGSWTPLVLESGDQFRADPPPPVGSPEMRVAAQELIRVKEELTDEQKRIATFWAGGEGTPLPPGVWVNVLLAYLRDTLPSEPRMERALALTTVAMSDAGIAAWDTKYAYWYPRPENAIQDMGLDPDWSPYIETPFFPAYTSGHAVYSGAAAEVLAFLFPDDAADFRAKAEEAAISRLWGGIHWRYDNEVGLAQGEKVGNAVVQWAASDSAGGIR